TYTQIANTTGAFNSFGRVVINDAGNVIFEAGLDAGGGSGIFEGGDPVADKLLLLGESLQPGKIISVIQLGDINSSGQFTLLTSQFGGDRQVWMGTLPEPTALAIFALPMMAALRRRR
ncbi:MAG: hypothetical protein H7144_07600, partial [Burkholderiales bacterium]|nr:hypothetical protein [Phycisphaerae bacterium]